MVRAGMIHPTAHRFALPVSGRAIALRHLTGVEDMLLVETARSDTELALDLAARLARSEDGGQLDWTLLSVTDLDACVLGLRRATIGDRIVAAMTCRAEGCGTRIDMSFTISGYIAHHRPKPGMPRLRGWSVAAVADEPGWFSLRRRGDTAEPVAIFRLPSGADLLAVQGHADVADALARRCMRPDDLTYRVRHRVEAAMEALAPNLASELSGVCPECRAPVTAHFDPRRFCLQELRDRARFIFDDIDVLARRYHWSERAILTLLTPRRASYAELARHGIA